MTDIPFTRSKVQSVLNICCRGINGFVYLGTRKRGGEIDKGEKIVIGQDLNKKQKKGKNNKQN